MSLDKMAEWNRVASVPKDSQNISVVFRTGFPFMTMYRAPCFLGRGAIIF
jgi:hypothetical protein